MDASIHGRWFHAESLATETRWPAFTPGARSLEMNAILSSPQLVGARPVGALNIYSRSAGAFTPSDQQRAELFATETSSILATAAVAVPEDEEDDRIADALQRRQVIAREGEP